MTLYIQVFKTFWPYIFSPFTVRSVFFLLRFESNIFLGRAPSLPLGSPAFGLLHLASVQASVRITEHLHCWDSGLKSLVRYGRWEWDLRRRVD